MVIHDYGPEPKEIYVGKKFSVALLGGGYWATDVELFGWCGRLLTPLYLSWMRQFTHLYPKEAAELGRVIAERRPDLIGQSVEVPFWYRAPEPIDIGWNDDECIRKECSRRQSHVAKFEKASVHEVQDAREHNAHRSARSA
jgi:hypothetical protein